MAPGDQAARGTPGITVLLFLCDGAFVAHKRLLPDRFLPLPVSLLQRILDIPVFVLRSFDDVRPYLVESPYQRQARLLTPQRRMNGTGNRM